MTDTRRQFIRKLASSTAVLLVALARPQRAFACMYGTWKLKCWNCDQIDTVTDGTCQHICENHACGQQVFKGSSVQVVCPQGDVFWIDTDSQTGDYHDTFICPNHNVNCNMGPLNPRRNGGGNQHPPKGGPK